MLQNKEDTTFITHLSELLSDKINGKIVKHHVEPLMEFGENFGSEILKVDLTVEDGHGKEDILHAVAKLLPQSEVQKEMFSVQVTFKSEIGFYNDIVPSLRDFRKEYGVPVMEFFPELYGARVSLKPESEVVDEDAVIVLENLKPKGFYNHDRCQGFDLESTKAVLQSLAQLQATTLALRKNKPEIFDTKVKPHLHEPRPLPPFNYDTILLENVRTAPLVGTINKLITKSQKTIAREPWATITHNDFWVNNIMVNDEGAIKLIDFQMPDFSSPARDLLFFLLSSVAMPVLRYHLDKLIQYYYVEFVAVLKQFQVDLREFTYEGFREELRVEGGLQVHHSLFMVPIILKPKSSEEKVLPFDGQHHFTGDMKEKIWFIVEEAARRKWI